MQININKTFSDWYDSLPYGEPTYQEAFEAGAAIGLGQKQQPNPLLIEADQELLEALIALETLFGSTD